MISTPVISPVEPTIFGLMSHSLARGGASAPLYDIYVDSINGSDSNPGTLAAPLQTLAAGRALIVANGSGTLRLARGSVFRESYEVPDGSAVRAYGSGALPIVSGTTPLPAGGWSKTGGAANVYQFAIDPDEEVNPYASVTHDSVLMVWDDGVRVGTLATRKTSVAEVDAAAGSFWYDDSGRVLYVHTSDGSDPGSNGRTYEASVRTLGIHGGDGVVVEDVQGDGCYAYDTTGQQGYGLLGHRSGTYRRCKATRGWNHLIGVANNESGTLLFEDCMAEDAEEISGAPATLFVGFSSGVGDPRLVTFRGCVARQPNAYGSIQTIGFYGHGTRVDLVYDNCAAENCYYGLQTWNNDPGASGSVQLLNGFRSLNCLQAVRANNPSVTTIAGLRAKGGQVAIELADNFTLTVDDLICLNTYGIYNFRGAGSDTILTNSIIAREVQASEGVATTPGGAAAQTRATGCIFHNLNSAYLGGVDDPTDDNQYSNCNRIVSDSQYPAGFYTDLATWQAATGLDANSTAASWTPPAGFFDLEIADPTEP